MSHAIDPLRTHALVVGVETYEDSDWNVAGPYADACAFISWLVKCGVPGKNVTLFASPLPASLPGAGDPAVLPEGVRPQEACSAVVSRHLQEGMRHLEADLLWVFWSGHGLIDSSGSHVLVLSDSSVDTKRVVDVDSLQLALQSTRLGAREGRGVPKVAVAVNACQNQPREDWISKVEVGVRHSYVTERGMFVMHGCSTGQRARVAPRERQGRGQAASLFPQALLRFLDNGTNDVLPDLHQVSDRVDAEFDDLRKKRLTWQKPSLLRRNWDGRTIATGDFLVPPTAEEQRLATLLDTVLPDGAARAACVAMLGERVPIVVPVSVGARHPTSQQIVSAAARTPHGVPTLLDLLSGLTEAQADTDTLRIVREAGRELRPNEYLTSEEHSRLIDLLSAPGLPDPRATALYDRRLRHHVAASADTDALVRSLEATGCRKDTGAIPPLFRFTSLLAAEAEARESVEALVEWGARVAHRTGHGEALASRLTTARQEAARRRGHKAWLLVRLDVDDPEAPTGRARYVHSAWLVDPVNRYPQALPCESGTEFSTWRHTQLALAELIEPLISMRHDSTEGQADLGVEFFLPRNQLELQVERIPVCHREVDNTPLGHVATVVVRCAGRRTAWHDRWNACHQNDLPGDHHWLRQDAKDLAALKAALDEQPNVGCVELTGSCPEFTPALAYCAEAGVPVMTWHRRIDGRRCDGDLADLRTVVHPCRLPEEVRQLRSDADEATVRSRNDLVLLWDDPGRVPPRIRPRVPGRIPRS
ncbi:caspase family protein [Streptomyces cyaneochromogenes]|uniref:Caspase family protein n=1 Tax=Streptomyces cyaneochromogenes TaxID=2496836 RepID=A0A3S5HT81_9ACTN|nr:caspase family protein [Streptomyces cyaneochromogenes]AZQ32314.1 caspase family protein [Streptomyces cyaneochromogenes]